MSGGHSEAMAGVPLAAPRLLVLRINGSVLEIPEDIDGYWVSGCGFGGMFITYQRCTKLQSANHASILTQKVAIYVDKSAKLTGLLKFL